MKTLINAAAALMMVIIATSGFAQTNLNSCPGTSLIVVAINSASLSNPSYSLNPGGITSAGPSFTVTPIGSVLYTLYVTGTNTNSAIITTTNWVNVNSSAPTFSLVSPQNYTLGCNTKSVATINITNGSTSPPGGPVSFTILGPGSSGPLPAGNLSSISSYTFNVAGTYTAVVKDNTNLCVTQTPFTITQNTNSPNANITVVQQVLDCNTSSLQLQGNSSTPNVTYLWSWPSISSPQTGNTLIVYTNTLIPTATLIANYTVTIQDNSSTCGTSTIIPIFQNIFSPNVGISGGGIFGATCGNTLVLTNISSTSIPPVFNPTAAVVSLLWQGPAPQPTIALSTTCLAQTSGIYTMTVKDLNNGCINTTTYNVVLGQQAAFTHTVTGGLATFIDVSTGTGTNTSYFWDFGDGNTSTSQNPTHTYLNGGAHFVKFKLTKPSAVPGIFCLDSIIQAVNVSGVPCLANSNFSMVPTGTAQVWNVVPAYPWNVSAATWNWGDGSSTNTLYTSHQYSAAGMYVICLSVTVSCASTSSTCTSYSVYRTTQEAMMVQVNVLEPTLLLGITPYYSQSIFSWNIAPNPNSGDFELYLNLVNDEEVQIQICDLVGRRVYETSFYSEKKAMFISIGDIPAGMYFVTLQTTTMKSTKQMIIGH